MKHLNEQGIVDSWLVAFMLTLVVLLGVSGFAVWALMSRNDYKNNVDSKIATAVEDAKKMESDKKDAEFKEKEKEPYRTYVGSATFASVSITYPKTWSAYVDESGNSGNAIDGYFNPALVPGLQSGNSIAIRMQVVNASYKSQLTPFDNLVKTKKASINPYSPPKVGSVVGVRVQGTINGTKQGTMIILPVRDKTLKIWTEGNEFVGDLDKIILANLSFVP